MIHAGIDIESVERFRELAQNGRFLRRVFTEGELQYCLSGKKPEKRLAAVFTAKEACMKALTRGFAGGVHWKDIEVVVNGGTPRLELHSKALELLGGRKAFLSISCTDGLAAGLVLIENAHSPH